MLRFGPIIHLMNGDNFVGMNMSITNLSKREESVKGLVDMFCLFVLQVAKKDNNMYLPTKFFLELLFSGNFVCLFSFSDILYFSLLFMFLCFILFFNFFFSFIHGSIQALAN